MFQLNQATQALDSLKSVLAAAGMNCTDVVKTTMFPADINVIYAEYFPGQTPAHSCIQAAALPKSALFEIEAVATR